VCAFPGVKVIRLGLRTALTAALLVGSTRTALAQTGPPVIRGDAGATIGWLSVRTPASLFYSDDTWQSSLFGTISTGWHWTDNLKSELDFGASTKMRTYRTDPIIVGGRPAYQTTRTTFSRRTLGIAQQYQFSHNAWFHPHVGAGAAITWEKAAAQGDPVFIYDIQGAGFAAPGTAQSGRRTVTVRPFVASGFKAYMTERTFFRSDIRVAFRGGIDEVLLRIGFGVDF
jgi:hypothetical protein